MNKIIRFFLENKLVTYLFLTLMIGWGVVHSPFDLGLDGLPKDPVSVDAIPDIGENQQIVFTPWPGRSPQDVEDQITYPLTSALLGIPGVKSIRSNSMFGFSSIYIIFKEDIEFYWSRSRILEKLNSLPSGILPDGVQPALGPDATALGQIYWYTLEGRDPEGNPTGGWDLHELRSIQDYFVRYGLAAAEGVSEVSSIGGYVKEYQVDVDPDAMRIYHINLEQVMTAIKNSNRDIGAQTLEINNVEYFVRGLGYVKNLSDIEESVVTTRNNVPIKIKDIARVNVGPADRRGALDKSGAQAVGGVVVARYGSNPLQVIQNVKEKIALLAPGLPRKTLADGTVSQVTIVPFYDRTNLIHETLGSLDEALRLEVLITIIVVILLLMNLRSSLLVAGSLPVAILMVFIAMKQFGVDANIVALSGIAIAIGTMVDMGIVLVESMIHRFKTAPEGEDMLTSVYVATTEVASAVITAVMTTIVSFLPVFTMQASEGKMFRPLAFTKTFALLSSIIIAVTIIPALAHTIFSIRSRNGRGKLISPLLLTMGGAILYFSNGSGVGLIALFIGLLEILSVLVLLWMGPKWKQKADWVKNILYALAVCWFLAKAWMPLGVEHTTFTNFLFLTLIIALLLGFFFAIIKWYENILRTILRLRWFFLAGVLLLVLWGFKIMKNTGQEFMPSLDEGSFLLMPTAMPHAGMEENLNNVRLLDMAVTSIPEVETVVGKLGHVESALDPAPTSMYENVILYKSEYRTDEAGHRLRFRVDDEGKFVRDGRGNLIPDKHGKYFRQWREHIHSPDDIWKEIVKHSKLPGVTSAPKLQPIQTRLVMLQTGMRAPMGIKVFGTDLNVIEHFGLELEKALKEVEGVKDAAVFAERMIGKPYLEIAIDRNAIALHGLTISRVQNYIQTAIGGMKMTETVEGRERYAIRLRYPKELRNDPDAISRVLLPTAEGGQIPLGEVADIRFVRGPQSIKSEDGFLVGYVLFDKESGYSEGQVVDHAKAYLNKHIESGALRVPRGITYKFAGNFEQQERANKRLRIVVPIALLIIFLILYFQFKSVPVTLMVFSGVFVAFAGGFIMIWLYGQDWFMNFEVLGVNMRDMFAIHPVNLSVAVWVGFLALFGIATDDGVLIATFLQESFKKHKPKTMEELRLAVLEGGKRRIRPAVMTSATTILALLPVLSSTGKGSDIMVPMAIPSFGGMLLATVTMFVVPVLFFIYEKWKLKWVNRKGGGMKWLGLVLIVLLAGNAKAQPLDSLLHLAVLNNPNLKALEQEYRADKYLAPQVDVLPDPEIGIGLFALPPETRLGPQRISIGASQMFPWKGTLQAKAAIADAKAEIKPIQSASMELDLAWRIRTSYYTLYKLEEKQRILKEDLRLFEALESLSMVKTRNGRASMSDVLRVQLKIRELERQIELLESSKQKPTSVINTAIGRSPEVPVRVLSRPDTSLPLTYDALLEKIRERHPGIELLELRKEIARRNIELNHYKAKPVFGVGLDYIAVGKRSDAAPAGNGRDILIPKMKIKVPLFRRQYRARDKEQNLRIASLEEQKKAFFLHLADYARQSWEQYENAGIRYRLYKEQVRTTRTIINILQADYSSAGKSFDELLKYHVNLIDYDLKILDAYIEKALAVAAMKRLYQGL